MTAVRTASLWLAALLFAMPASAQIQEASTTAALDAAVSATLDERMPLQMRVLSRGASAVPELANAARSEPAADDLPALLRQRIAIWALGELGGAEACDAIASVDAPNEATELAVAIARARCGDTEPLRATVRGTAATDVRLKAAIWLALEGDDAIRDDVMAMQHEEGFASLGSVVVLALGLLGEEGARPTLEAMRRVPELRDHASIALLRLGDLSASIDARIAASNEDPHVRYHALRALTELHIEGTRSLLHAASDDLSPRIARYAAREARLWPRRSAPR